MEYRLVKSKDGGLVGGPKYLRYLPIPRAVVSNSPLVSGRYNKYRGTRRIVK